MNEIKRCPFCGGEAVLYTCISGGKRKYYLLCSKCRTEQGKAYSTKQYAIKIWNRRVNEDESVVG